MFRLYVKEYHKKEQHKTYQIEYKGKVQSMTKWRKELNISPFSLYELVNNGKTFQEAFDILTTVK